MDDARGVTVRFEATVKQFAKAGGKPGKLMLEVGDAHASAILGLVGEDVTVTLEGMQTVLPQGEVEGQTVIHVHRETGEVFDPADDSEPSLPDGDTQACAHPDEVAGCSARGEYGECSAFAAYTPSLDDCRNTVMALVPEPLVEVDEDSTGTLPDEDIPFLPMDDEGDVTCDDAGESNGAVEVERSGDDSTSTIPAGDYSEPTVPTQAPIGAIEVSNLLKLVETKGDYTAKTCGGKPTYRMRRKAGGVIELTVTGHDQDGADECAHRIGVQAGVELEPLSCAPSSRVFTYRGESANVFPDEVASGGVPL